VLLLISLDSSLTPPYLHCVRATSYKPVEYDIFGPFGDIRTQEPPNRLT